MGRADGKVVLITGAARGMGEAHARLLTDEGATVIVTDVLDDLGEKVAADLGARYEHLDVRSESDWADVMANVGRLDGLVNNAGVLHYGALEDTSLADYLDVVQVNQVGCFLGMRAALPALRASGSASIVNVSSIAGMQGAGNLVAYAASKWAVRGMTKCAALELAPDGIRVNSLHPGTVLTAMTGGDAEVLDANCSEFPIPRAARTPEIAAMVLFLISDESSFCTGAEFVVDGGTTAGPAAALVPPDS